MPQGDDVLSDSLASTRDIPESGAPTAQRTQDSLTLLLNTRLPFLERENALYKSALDTNSNLFSGISTLFTVISILLAIFTIALPIVNYFLVIKPNRKVVAKVNKLESEVLQTIEENLETYIQQVQQKRLKEKISLLDDPNQVLTVLNYLVVHNTVPLDEEDIGNIILFLSKDLDVEKASLHHLHKIAIYSGLPIAEKYYKVIFESEDEGNYEYAIQYFVANDFPQHIKYLEKIIIAEPNGHSLLLRFYEFIKEKFLGGYWMNTTNQRREEGISYIKLLFNNDRIIAGIENKQVPQMKLSGKHPIDKMEIQEYNFLRETKYYSRYLKNHDQSSEC